MRQLRTRRSLRTGLSFIEVMVNLVIVAVLLLAVTTTLQSLVGQFRGNETALRSRRAATVALDYILAYIRQAKDVDLGSAPTNTAEVTTNKLTLIDYFDRAHPEQMRWRVFRYDSDGKVLKLSVNGGAEQVVLQNVLDLKFRAKPEYDSIANVVTWRSVTVDLKIETADMAGKRVPMSFSGATYARSIPLS